MSFKRIYHFLDHLNLGIGVIFILGIGSLTLMNVILRFFNIAMMGYIELIEVMMIVAALCAMAMAVAGKIQVSTVKWIIEGGYREQTDILHIPILPFQILWVLGLLFICIFYLRDSVISLKRRLKG
jgi:TRAP-type C4-dicarboxylate transport system permease small subunit